MKTNVFTIVIVGLMMLCLTMNAQTPQAFKYQTVVRNTSGEPVEDQNVTFRFSIRENLPDGPVAYSETHAATTNSFGLVSLSIGTGTVISGDFSEINWGENLKFLEVELDITGGADYLLMGTSQLLSVPYALYAENTANNNDADADPTNELQTLSIEGNNLSISEGNTVVLPAPGLDSRIADADGDTWIETETGTDNDSIIFSTFGMRRMVISDNGYVVVNGQIIATSFQGEGSGLTGVPGDNLGDHHATEELNMDNHRIVNVVSPTDGTDAATKLYVDTQISMSGDNLGNHSAEQELNMNNHRIVNVDSPTDGNDAATKLYVDTQISMSGDNLGNHIAEQELNMDNHRIMNISSPTEGNDAASKLYVDTQISMSGDNLGDHNATQNIVLNSNWISNDGDNEGIFIDTTGRVGINTIYPNTELSVIGSIQADQQIRASYGSASNATFRFGFGAENTGFSSPNYNTVAVITDGNERMTIDQIGNVGIGVASPGAKLDINGHIWQSGTGGSVFIGYQAGANDDLSDNKNVALGYQALNANTTGNSNCATGFESLNDNISGEQNAAYGFASLYKNTEGSGNSSAGYRSLYSNTTGNDNTAYGNRSLYNNTTGSNNIAIGNRALFHNTNRSNLLAIGDSALFSNGVGATEYDHGRFNTAVGHYALRCNTTGYSNTAFGSKSLYSNTTGLSNSSFGYEALYSSTNADGNSAFGHSSQNKNTSGSNNSSFGAHSLYHNTEGGSNDAFGRMTLYHNTTGVENAAFGFYALMYNVDGDRNTSFGKSSLFSNINGYANSAHGFEALSGNESGNYNSAFGYRAFFYGSSYSNSTALGYYSEITSSNQVRIGNSSVTSIGGYSNWTNLSDARFKKNVKENVPGLDFVLKLKPVTYSFDIEKLNEFLDIPDSISQADDFLVRSMNEKSMMVQTGFIAQDVESVANELGFDFSGIDKPKNENDHYGLRYAEFVVPLVKAIQEQQLMIIEQKLLIENLQKEINQIKNER